MNTDAEIQRAYYERTAAQYDDRHVADGDEHDLAFSVLMGLIGHYKYTSALDVGAGTGRGVSRLKSLPGFKAVGVEPVKALRETGYLKGIEQDELIDGDALSLPFEDNSFDVVCASAILHHIKDHQAAVAEICRVARHAIFISDANNFGQGGPAARLFKQILAALGLWRGFDWIRTRGKGYHWSEGDGLFYSYSVFSDLPVVRTKFSSVHFFNTMTSGPNLYRSAPQLAVFATR